MRENVNVASWAAATRPHQGKLWSNLKEVCDLMRITCGASANDQETQFQHVLFKPDQRVHTVGQQFESLYVVYSGFLKTVSINESGCEQITDFPMRGDILGCDCIDVLKFSSEAVALTECNVIILPFKKVASICRNNYEFAIYSAMSRELRRKQEAVNVLGAPNAESRIARFLVFLSERFGDIGCSRTNFNLRMTRSEIASYLGVSLETVSRSLSSLHDSCLIEVNQRSIKIRDVDSLKNFHRPSRRTNRLAA